MRKSIGLAAVAVLCLAGSITAVTAGTPIRGTVVKGGHNPSTDDGSAAVVPTKSGHAINSKGTGTDKRTSGPHLGDADGDGTVEDHAVTKDPGGERRGLVGLHIIQRTKSPVDPKTAQPVVKVRTKSNQSNE